jgi:hypothetical protein
MQLITFLSATAATVATASAFSSVSAKDWSAVLNNAECKTDQPHARIVNRCDYPVNIWSVLKGNGCPTGNMVTLKTGESYNENYILASKSDGKTGVSIKISKTEECKGNDITQLEYFLDDVNRDEQFRLNYLDVSYVDCQDEDCPAMKEGYYLRVGNKAARAEKVTMDNSWCPIQSCDDPASCGLISYILPDDVRTKTCDFYSNMELYLCGSEAPSEEDAAPASSAPASSQKAETSAPKPSSTVEASSSKADSYNVKAAAVVTPAAEVPEVKEPKVKTKVVYVTAYEYINAKRSEHGHAQAHARRHQAFHA